MSHSLSKNRKPTSLRKDVLINKPTSPMMGLEDLSLLLKQEIDLMYVTIESTKAYMESMDAQTEQDPFMTAINVEQKIKMKDDQIKALNQAIQSLRLYKVTPPNRAIQNPQQLMTQQYRKLREQLLTARQDYTAVMKQYREVHSEMERTQGEFQEECEKYGIEFISYEEFVTDRLGEKPIFQSPEKVTPKFDFHVRAAHQGPFKESLKKIMITENALKSARTKHSNQMNELQGKLDFLKEQHRILSDQVQEAQAELLNMQKRIKTRSYNTSSLQKYRSEKYLEKSSRIYEGKI